MSDTHDTRVSKSLLFIFLTLIPSVKYVYIHIHTRSISSIILQPLNSLREQTHTKKEFSNFHAQELIDGCHFLTFYALTPSLSGRNVAVTCHTQKCHSLNHSFIHSHSASSSSLSSSAATTIISSWTFYVFFASTHKTPSRGEIKRISRRITVSNEWRRKGKGKKN